MELNRFTKSLGWVKRSDWSREVIGQIGDIKLSGNFQFPQLIILPTTIDFTTKNFTVLKSMLQPMNIGSVCMHCYNFLQVQANVQKPQTSLCVFVWTNCYHSFWPRFLTLNEEQYKLAVKIQCPSDLSVFTRTISKY